MHLIIPYRSITLLLFVGSFTATLAAEDASVIDRRLAESAKFLASDEQEGRGIGTKGLDRAAEYLANQFGQMGLKTSLFDGTAYQTFKMSTGANLGPRNSLALVGPPAKPGGEPERVELKLNESFSPLAIGGSGKFDLPLVFVGYGITAKDEKYDDYAGIDVKDKAVVILRHEPQQANPHSEFDGTNNSQYAPFNRKVSNAYEHGAAAVLLLNDDFDIQKNLAQIQKKWQGAVDAIVEQNKKFSALDKPTDADLKTHREKIDKLADDIKAASKQSQAARDPILLFTQAGGDSAGRNMPVLFCRRAEVAKVIQAAGADLAVLEREIDKGPTPKSQVLNGWRAVGETTVLRKEVDVKNVVAVLEGAGPLAEETVVIGAHYDHLGLGGAGSLAPGSKEIHNGADDNGSGTTVLLEVARELAARDEKPRRRLVFIAFTGEEEGLIGSARYVRNPLFPLESTVAMLNMDMVGRLKDEKLIVHGTGTAPEFDPLVDKYGKELGFQIIKKPGGFGPSDHSSFYAKKIPVLHFFTGNHSDYHRPSDDFDKLNIAGMRRVTQMVAAIASEVARAEKRPQYVETKAPAGGGRGGDRPYFGSIPDFSQDQPGYALTGVTKDGPAERAGIRAGDIIIQLGPSKIGNLEDFDSALRKFKGGDKVPVVVKRGKEEVKVEVTLDPPR